MDPSNIIVGAKISDQKYTIGSAALVIAIQPFSEIYSICGGITYSMWINGVQITKNEFISLDSINLLMTV